MPSLHGHRKLLALIIVLVVGVGLELYQGLTDSATMFLVGILGTFVAGNSVSAALGGKQSKSDLAAIQETLEHQNNFLARTEDLSAIHETTSQVLAKFDDVKPPPTVDLSGVARLEDTLLELKTGAKETLQHLIAQVDAVTESQKEVLRAQQAFFVMQKETNDGLLYVAKQVGVQGR